MDLKLHYKDPSWNSPSWAVTCGTKILEHGLTVGQAIQKCKGINLHNLRNGIEWRGEVKFMDYPESQRGRDECWQED